MLDCPPDQAFGKERGTAAKPSFSFENVLYKSGIMQTDGRVVFGSALRLVLFRELKFRH